MSIHEIDGGQTFTLPLSIDSRFCDSEKVLNQPFVVGADASHNEDRREKESVPPALRRATKLDKPLSPETAGAPSAKDRSSLTDVRCGLRWKLIPVLVLHFSATEKTKPVLCCWRGIIDDSEKNKQNIQF